MQVEDEIAAEGVQIIWVLQEDSSVNPGTAAECRRLLDNAMSARGLCVGDGQTQPTPGVFTESDLAIGRGYDIVVRRSDMEIIYHTTHGTPAGNDNLTGQELLDAIRQL